MDEPTGRERARALIMAALDGELTPGERQELEALAAGSPETAAEWRRMARVKEVTTGMTLNEPPQEVWDRYWGSVYRRSERGVAWALISAGALVVLAYALWHAVGELWARLLTDSSLPVPVRVAVVVILAGAAILLVSIVRERIFTARRDPYSKEVIR